jgi:hypothetical protein
MMRRNPAAIYDKTQQERDNIQGSGTALQQICSKTEPAKIVVRFLNGEVLKGYTNNFFPNKPIFKVTPLNAHNPSETRTVQIKDLKALFFVRDFDGDSSYNEEKSFPQDKQHPGRKIEITFHDNETLVGTTFGYDPNRPGFFLHPADSQSNNERIFAVSAAVKKIRYL